MIIAPISNSMTNNVQFDAIDILILLWLITLIDWYHDYNYQENSNPVGVDYPLVN